MGLVSGRWRPSCGLCGALFCLEKGQKDEVCEVFQSIFNTCKPTSVSLDPNALQSNVVQICHIKLADSVDKNTHFTKKLLS